jgi:hypothetical protein
MTNVCPKEACAFQSEEIKTLRSPSNHAAGNISVQIRGTVSKDKIQEGREIRVVL